MTRRIGNLAIIENEPPRPCELCGAVEELRPYGPNGESICFDCGMKDEAGTLAKFTERMRGITAAVPAFLNRNN